MFNAKIVHVDIDLFVEVHVYDAGNVRELEQFRREDDFIILDRIVEQLEIRLLVMLHLYLIRLLGQIIQMTE